VTAFQVAHTGLSTLKPLWFQAKSSSLHVSLRRQTLPPIVQRAVQTLKTRLVFDTAVKKKFFGFGFFVSDVICGTVLGHFVPLHLAVGPTARW